MNTSNVKVTPCNNFRPQLWKENVCRECFCLKERHGPKVTKNESFFYFLFTFSILSIFRQ